MFKDINFEFIAILAIGFMIFCFALTNPTGWGY